MARPPGNRIKYWHCYGTTKNNRSKLSVIALTLSTLQLFLVVAQQCHVCLPGGREQQISVQFRCA